MRTRIATTLALAWLAAASAFAHPHPDAPAAPGESGAREGRRFHHFERFLPHQSRLGVQLQEMTPELREFLRAPKERGVLVVRVNPDSPAAKAGLRVGDVIVSVAGESITAPHDLVHEVLRAEKDAKLALELVRDGKTRSLEATLEGEPALAADPMRWVEERAPEFREKLEQRMRELEERLEQLEQRLRGASETKSDELDT
jgi:C-terminal processing protease CtpA/Prc